MTNPDLLARQFDIVREDLHRRYDALHPAEHVDDVLDQVIAERSAAAKITTFLPVTVERAAAELLEAQAEAMGAEPAPRREVLYVDERNAGRSQLAAAITGHLAGEELFVRSVGLNPVGGINPMVLQVLEERGIRTSHLYQKQHVARTVHRSDVVVLMGVKQTPDIPGDRYVSWDIEDPEGLSLQRVRAICDDVDHHVHLLLRELGITPAPAEARAAVAR